MAEKKKEEEPAFRYLIPDSWMPYWRAGSFIALAVCCWYWFDGPQWWAEAKFFSSVSSGSGVSAPLPAEDPRPTVSENPRPTSSRPPARERKEIRVQVDPVEWSGWIELPANHSWEITQATEWFEVWFWDGRKVKAQGEEKVWVGTIPNNTFRIRGSKGELVITLEPK